METHVIENLAKEFVIEYLGRDPEYLDIVEFVEENDHPVDEIAEYVAERVSDMLEEVRNKIRGWNE